jgi:nucleotide-binding universal stress UspA family protein
MVPVRDVHVVIGQDGGAAGRIALDLAQRFGAHVTGLAIEEQPELTHYMDEARAVVRTRVAEAAVAFEEAAGAAGVTASTVRLPVPVNGSLDDVLRRCRLSDLVVVGRAGSADGLVAELIRQLLFDSAAPVLVVPPAAVRCFGRAVIAWDGRPVAAHAIHSALPLLDLAEDVTILSVVGNDARTPDSGDLAAHLARHGIATAHRSVPAEGSVTDALLNYVSEERIDWITMGAFGHGRLREILFGSPTRDMLAGAPVPVLMHH